MDGYEKAILPAACRRDRAGLVLGPAALAGAGGGRGHLLAIALYTRTPTPSAPTWPPADQVFLLKYLLSSQSAILWMCVLFFMSTVFYWIGLPSAGRRPQRHAPAHGLGRAWPGPASSWRWWARWCAGSRATRSRPDIGHIPVSNLYEVFVLFCWLTALFYLYYEQHYRTRALGGFVMLVVSAAVGFLLWYTVARDAHEIQPLVPALQSWWMKLHVPANFIGYGTFALAAMVAFAYLLKAPGRRDALVEAGAAGGRWGRAVLRALRSSGQPRRHRVASYWARVFGGSSPVVGGILALRRRIAARCQRPRCWTT
jgi:ABC-type transport system involved in cytochrome c biogenesis permease subunit